MLSLTIFTRSPISSAISASSGVTFRHGTHHSAQKSTSTGLSDCSTSVAKLASVTSLVPTFSPSLAVIGLRAGQSGEVALSIDSGSATAAGGGDRLAVGVVDE